MYLKLQPAEKNIDNKSGVPDYPIKVGLRHNQDLKQ
ncbi:uncharacterized protein METZ01_LOCUS247812 [marine metagenome]|uniref:Uncharacterized protein n=1 Tax=marine metagenome TaxID=408172 RepID=A0A382I5Y7_9ZZZZ